MKTLMQWLRLHPLKAVLFTMIFTALATSAAWRDDLFGKCAVIYFVILAVWSIIFTLDMRKIMGLLLVGSFFYTPCLAADPPPQENIAGIGVGVVVVCVGGYCVYRVVKVCQKKFPPKSTNAPPEELNASGEEYGGAYEYSSIGSCYVPPTFNSFPYEDLLQNPTTFSLRVTLQGGAIRTSMKANNEEGTAQTWDQFAADMAEHGLFLTGHPASQPQFERDGIPCDVSSVPLEFDLLTGRVTQNSNSELHRLVIERSPNLQDWSSLMVTDISDGTGFQVVDTTREGQMFYRVQVTQP